MSRRAICMAAVVWLFSVSMVEVTRAQSSEPKAEIVGQFTWLRRETFPSNYKWKAGGGAVFGYDLNKNVSLDLGFLAFGKGTVLQASEADHIPQPEFQGLFGIKAGVKREKYGVFAKLRPGFSRLSVAQDCDGDSFSSCRGKQKNAFTVDYGGVFEAYPLRRVVVRADVGAAYTRYPDRRFFIPSEPGSSIPFPGVSRERGGFSRNLLQFSIGAGFRF
jgi:hypothetical protein